MKNEGSIIMVDYTKTIEKVILDGKYDDVNLYVSDKYFPISPELVGKKIETKFKLFCFDATVRFSSERAIDIMDGCGCRPANLMELLCFNVKSVSIVALGSSYYHGGDERYIPCLRVSPKSCVLELKNFGTYWGRSVNNVYHFLGVYK